MVTAEWQFWALFERQIRQASDDMSRKILLQWGPKSTENRLSSATVTQLFNCALTKLARQSELEKLVIYPSQHTSSKFPTPPYESTTMALLNLQGRPISTRDSLTLHRSRWWGLDAVPWFHWLANLQGNCAAKNGQAVWMTPWEDLGLAFFKPEPWAQALEEEQPRPQMSTSLQFSGCQWPLQEATKGTHREWDTMGECL